MPPPPTFDYALLPPEKRRLLAELLREAQIVKPAEPAPAKDEKTPVDE